MINLVRLDERLIHGQIATTWSKYTGVTHIVVADDEAAENSVIKKSLLMAAPGNLKTVIKSTKDAIDLLNDPRCESMRILVLVKTPDTLVKLLEGVKGISQVNIGNYGRSASNMDHQIRKAYGKNFYFSEEERAVFKRIDELTECAYYQTMPEETAIELKKILNQ